MQNISRIDKKSNFVEYATISFIFIPININRLKKYIFLINLILARNKMKEKEKEVYLILKEYGYNDK